MKVKLTKDQLVGFVWREAGEVVEVDNRRGEIMIRDKAATRADAASDSPVESPPDAASRFLIEQTTGRPTRVPPPELTGEILPKPADSPEAEEVQEGLAPPAPTKDEEKREPVFEKLPDAKPAESKSKK